MREIRRKRLSRQSGESFLDKTYGARKGNGFIHKAEENDKKEAEKKWCF